MAKETKSKRYEGVYFRELSNGDRSYFLRMRIDGKTKRFHVGKKSEGITEAFCYREKARIINEHRFGERTAAELQKVKKDDPTFGDLFEWYLEKRELKASTVEHLQILRKAPFYNSQKITREDVQHYVDGLAQEKRPATVTLRYRQIRAVFRYAVARDKYRYPDPTVGIDLPKGTGPRKRYLTAEEMARLLEAVQDDKRLYLFVKMSLYTGARIGTLLTVRADDIKPDGSVTLINHKAGRTYTGFFDAETMALLEGRRGYVLALKGKEDRVPSMQSLQYKLQDVMNRLFNPPGTPIDERAVVHSLRHSVATQQMRKGVPIEVISKTLDHASPVITAQVYGKVAPDLIRRAVTNLWD